jgi:YHS domain-containing protein
VLRFLLLAILILFVARAFWRVMDGVIEAAGGKRRAGGGGGAARPVKLQRDPVCGTFVAPSNALSLTNGRTTLYFCSERCRDEYQSR